jgi:pimeloyl-ACP methyl ester carboxylesterase
VRTTTVNPLSDPPNLNDAPTIVSGLTDFVAACAVDERPKMTDAELFGALAFNLLTPAAVRLAIMGRSIDNRNFFSALSERDRGRVLAITGDADEIFRADVLNKLWRACGIESRLSPGDGHMPMSRNADYFNSVLLQLAS